MNPQMAKMHLCAHLLAPRSKAEHLAFTSLVSLSHTHPHTQWAAGSFTVIIVAINQRYISKCFYTHSVIMGMERGTNCYTWPIYWVKGLKGPFSRSWPYNEISWKVCYMPNIPLCGWAPDRYCIVTKAWYCKPVVRIPKSCIDDTELTSNCFSPYLVSF